MNKFVLAERFEWLCNDGITVIAVEDNEVFSAATRSDGERTCLVRGYLAGDFNGLQECHFGSDAGFRGWNRRCCHFWRIVVYGRGGGDLGGPNILSLLAKMPLVSCEHLGKMFADELRGEAGPTGVIAGIDGQCPCRYDWAKIIAMEITDKIRLGCQFVGAVRIRCGERQSVSDGGFRARSKVDVV